MYFDSRKLAASLTEYLVVMVTPLTTKNSETAKIKILAYI